MDDTIEHWKAVRSFAFLNDHMMVAQPEEFGSRIICERNDGRTFHFYFGDRSFIASNIGDRQYLITYDVRPNLGGYNLVNGRYVPSPDGDVQIEGFFPNYRIAGIFIPVYIGPHLYFYTEPQDDIINLAKTGQLRAPTVHIVRQCLTCRREIPKAIGPRAKYCSIECGLVTRDMQRRQRAARAETRKFELPKLTPVRKCKTCDGVIPKELGGRVRYCSVECGLMTREMQKQGKQSPCDYCAKPFKRYGRQRFCSEECKLRSKLDALR